MKQLCDLSGIYWKNPFDRFFWEFVCKNQWVLFILIILIVLGITIQIIQLWREV